MYAATNIWGCFENILCFAFYPIMFSKVPPASFNSGFALDCSGLIDAFRFGRSFVPFDVILEGPGRVFLG